MSFPNLIKNGSKKMPVPNKTNFYGDVRLFAFCHIPKTAGTSINLVLRRHFGSRILSAIPRSTAVKNVYQPENLIQDCNWFPDLAGISGHYLRPFINFNPVKRRLRWFTFLRDPSRRFISHFIHQQTNGRHPAMDIREWSIQLNRSNFQVKWIAGDEDLEAAKQILDEKFSFVGFVDNFENDIQHLAKNLCWDKFKWQVPANQMTARDLNLKRKIQENYHLFQDCIEENNQLDNQLFEYAKKKFGCDSSNQKTKGSIKQLTKQHGMTTSFFFKYNLARFQFRDKLNYRARLKLQGHSHPT